MVDHVSRADDIDLDELCAEALAATPEPPLGDDAVSFWTLTRRDGDDGDLLPQWYMPAPMEGGPRLSGWRRRAALLVVIAFVGINASGLCSTYGWVGFG